MTRAVPIPYSRFSFDSNFCYTFLLLVLDIQRHPRQSNLSQMILQMILPLYYLFLILCKFQCTLTTYTNMYFLFNSGNSVNIPLIWFEVCISIASLGFYSAQSLCKILIYSPRDLFSKILLSEVHLIGRTH